MIRLRGLYQNLGRIVPCGLGPFGDDLHFIRLACDETKPDVLPPELEAMRVRTLALISPPPGQTYEDRSRRMTNAERDELRGIVERLYVHAKAAYDVA